MREKDARFELRLSQAEKQRVRKAALLLGIPMSVLMRQIVVESAEAIIRMKRQEITTADVESAVATSVSDLIVQGSVRMDPRQLELDEELEAVSETFGGGNRET